MGERECDVQPYGVEYACEDCKIGTMVSFRPYTDSVPLTLSVQPLYPHRCTHCGATQDFPTVYPSLRYRFLPQDRP